MNSPLACLPRQHAIMRLFGIALLLVASFSMVHLRAQELHGAPVSTAHCDAMAMAQEQAGDDEGHDDLGKHGKVAKGASCAMACACITVDDLYADQPFRLRSLPQPDSMTVSLAGIEPTLLLPPPKG